MPRSTATVETPAVQWILPGNRSGKTATPTGCRRAGRLELNGRGR